MSRGSLRDERVERGRRGSARADVSGYPERARVSPRRRISWWRWCGGFAVVAALFVGYLRVSWTVAATSDGAAQALQARDMLAGNWLLHGWTLSDVSFYTTELPEYVLVEAVRPVGLGVIHIAAAATYTLLVLAVCALARGRAGGREGILRSVLASAIVLAPQLGYGAFVLLLSPDHVGTQVPLLVGWLLLDLGPRRWWVPTVLCLLLAVVQFADRVAVLTAVLPLIVVCGVAAVRRRPRRVEAEPGRRAGRLAGRWALDCRYELALVAAGLLSAGVAWAAARVLAAAGGFAGHPFPLTLAPVSLLWTHAWLTGWGVLELYGGNFIGVTGWAGITFAVLHLIGLTLAIAAVAVALVRFLRPNADQRVGAVAPSANRPRALWPTAPIGLARRVTAARGRWRCGPPRQTGGREPGPRVEAHERAEARGETQLVDSVLAVAVVANLLSYLVSTAPGTVLGTGYDAREIAAVLPLGAVLAGRVFGAALAGAILGAVAGGAGLAGGARRPRGWAQLNGGAESTVRSKISIFISFILFLVIAGYIGAFGYSAAQAGAPGQESVLASWLVAHGLRYGLGGSSANVVTVDSGGRVDVMPVAVRGGRVRALLYQTSAAAYDPRLHDANFLVTGVPAAQRGETGQTAPYSTVRATFGPAARSYRFDGYTVLVWRVNLLTRMRE
jgi:hypothetical protein